MEYIINNSYNNNYSNNNSNNNSYSSSYSNNFIFTQREKRTKINRRFTKEEDENLVNLVEKYGESDWMQIAEMMKNRNARQCKDRWFQYLAPTVNKKPWTKEEDERLMQLVSEYGPKWLYISKFFDGRHNAHIRNRYKTIQKKFESSINVEYETEESSDISQVEGNVECEESADEYFTESFDDDNGVTYEIF